MLNHAGSEQLAVISEDLDQATDDIRPALDHCGHVDSGEDCIQDINSASKDLIQTGADAAKALGLCKAKLTASTNSTAA